MCHICVIIVIIVYDSGVVPALRREIIWTNVHLPSIEHQGTDFSEMPRKIHSISSRKNAFEYAVLEFSVNWLPPYVGNNIYVLIPSTWLNLCWWFSISHLNNYGINPRHFEIHMLEWGFEIKVNFRTIWLIFKKSVD